MLTHARTEEFKRAAVEGLEVAEDRQRRARLSRSVLPYLWMVSGI
jgi:hypothetical protein